MNTKRIRNSNMEFLRIFAMILIIAFHIIYHCVVEIQLTDPQSMARFQNGLFNSPAFYRNLLLLSAVMPMGPVGNAVFLLISGFYRVDPAKTIDPVKTGAKLLTQTGFAAVTLVLFSFLCTFLCPRFSTNPLSIQVFNSMCWFVGYYFLVTLIAWLFLNRFLITCSRMEYLSFLLALFAVVEFGWSGKMLESLASGLRTLLTGVFLYALGGFIRRFRPFRRVRAYVLLLTILVMFLFVDISAYNTTILKIGKYFQKGKDDPFIQTISKYPNYSIVVIIIGVCLFELFLRLRVRSSRFLNFLGASTFMVYLIHDNKFFYSLWNLQDWITPLYHRPLLFIGRLFAWVFVIFAMGVLLYTICQALASALGQSRFLFRKDDQENAG